MKLIFICVGESELCTEKYNDTCRRLTPLGRIQSYAIEARLKNEPIDAVLVSSLNSSLDTYKFSFKNRSNIKAISSDTIREYVSNQDNYRRNIDNLISEYPDIDFKYLIDSEDFYKCNNICDDNISIENRCTSLDILLSTKDTHITTHEYNGSLVIISHKEFLNKFMELYGSKYGIYTNNGFVEGEVRYGYINH